MRFALPTFVLLLFLAACAAGDRIYDVSEVDEPPALVGDSLIIVAPAPDSVRHTPERH